MALQICDLADKAVVKLNGLLQKPSFGDMKWTNEVCRAMNVVDKVLRGKYNLFLEIDAMKLGGKVAERYVCGLNSQY